jgi:hypothetical protein
MKSSAMLTAGLLALGGCVMSPPTVPFAPPPMHPTPTVAPVRPEQVTPQTAEKMSQALADELDREVQRDLTPPASLRP